MRKADANISSSDRQELKGFANFFAAVTVLLVLVLAVLVTAIVGSPWLWAISYSALLLGFPLYTRIFVRKKWRNLTFILYGVVAAAVVVGGLVQTVLAAIMSPPDPGKLPLDLVGGVVAGLLAALAVPFTLVALVRLSAQAVLGLHEWAGVTPNDAFGYLWSIILGTNQPWVVVENGEVVGSKKKGILDTMGGPGLLIVRPGNAVVLQRIGEISQIVGPGLHRVRRHEKIRQIVRLGPLWNTQDVEGVLTRDGVPLTIRLGVGYRIEPKEDTDRRIGPPANPGVIEGDYLVYEDTIRKAVLNVTPIGWEITAVAGCESLLRDIVGTYTLDELFGLEAVERAASGEAIEAHESQRVIKRIEERIFDGFVLTAAGAFGTQIRTVDIQSILVPEQMERRILETGAATWIQRYIATKESTLSNLLSDVAKEDSLPAPLMLQIEWKNTEIAIGDRPHVFERRTQLLTVRVCDVLDLSVLPQHYKEGTFHAFLIDVSSVFKGLKMPDAIPMVFLQQYEYRDEDVFTLIRLLNTGLDRTYQIALLMLFGSEADVALSEERVVERMRTYSIDVIPMGYHDWEVVARSPNSLPAFRRIILSRVDLAVVAPFIDTGPTTEAMFFGRESEIRDIVEHVAESSRAIIGGRRIGKTSVLRHLHCVRLPAAGFYSLYHDCSTTPDLEAFLSTTIQGWQPAMPINAPPTFGDLLRFPVSDKLLVLLLDEADKIVPVDRASGWPFFNALRALANSGRAQVVLSGERTLREALQDSTSPLFNFASEMLLRPLEFHSVEELITRPMKQLDIGLVDEKAIVNRIWTFTSGHPNVVQRLCRRLIERLNEKRTRSITLDEVNAVIEDPRFQRDDFLNTYWQNATLLERVLSLLLAQAGQQPYTLRDVRRLLDERLGLLGPDGAKPSGIEVGAAMDRLVELRSILKHMPQGYVFAVSAFPLVVTQPDIVTIDDLFDIYGEAYTKHGDLTLEEVADKEQGR
jgi:regulator of protease activity HflC (stomatin/prohibitin superfamily)